MNVVKRDGRREPFDRDKLLRGLQRAAAKRAVEPEQLEELVDSIQAAVRQRGGEAPAEWVGELALGGLARLDRVAAVMFASVYRSIEDLSAFEAELPAARIGAASRGPISSRSRSCSDEAIPSAPESTLATPSGGRRRAPAAAPEQPRGEVMPVTRSATEQSSVTGDGGLTVESSLHRGRHPPIRHGRVGDSRRDHRQPGQAGVRAARRRVPDDLVAERHQHRRPEVLPRADRTRPSASRRSSQMVGRVAGTIAGWGREGGYFATRRGRRRVRGRAHLHPSQPARGVQLAGLVQRRLRGAPAVLGLLHPLGRGRARVDPRLEHQGGQDLPRRLRLGHQPVEDPRLEGAALQGRPRHRARSRSCAAPTRGPARSSRAARRGARPRWSCSTSTIRTSSTSSGARRARRRRPLRCATPASTCASTRSVRVDPVPEREQLGARDRRVHEGGRARRQVAHAGARRPASRSTSTTRAT